MVTNYLRGKATADWAADDAKNTAVLASMLAEIEKRGDGAAQGSRQLEGLARDSAWFHRA